MRVMPRLAAGALLLLLAATTAAAWLVPPRMDAGRFRGPLETIAARVLAAPVRIEGPIRLRLLPQPELSAGSLAIAAARPDDVSLSADGVRLRLALGPLVVGRIEPRTLVLLRPDIRVPPARASRILAGRRPGWLAGASARIEDGRVQIGGLGLSGVDAAVSIDALSGELAVAGVAAAAGHAWSAAAHLTAPGRDGAAGIDLSLAGTGGLRGVALSLSGQIAADGSLQGRVTARGPDLSLLLPAPAQRFSAEGRVSVESGLAAADDLTVELGGAPSRGALALRFAPALRLDLALAASRLDLDPWLAALRRGEARPPFLAAIPVGIDLSAEAAALGGGMVRGLRAAFDLSPGRVELRELRVMLPGEAALRLSGSVATAPALRIEADAGLDAPALRTTMAWLAPLLPPLAGLPPDALRAAVLTGHVVADRTTIVLTRLRGTLDGGALRGSLGWGQGAGGGAAITGALSLQRLDLGAWLASWLAAGGPGPALDLQLGAEQAELRGVALSGLSLDITRQDGVTALRRLDTAVGGARVQASGRLSAAGRLDAGRVVVDAPGLNALAAAASWWQPAARAAATLPPGAALRQSPMHLAIDASGADRALSLRFAGAVGTLQFDLQPTVDLATGRWQGPIALRDPGARALLDAAAIPALTGLPVHSRWLGEGSLAAQAACSGGPQGLSIDQLDLTAGALRARGSLRLGWAGPPDLSATIEADILPLPALTRSLADAVLLGGLPDGRARLQVRARQVLQDGAPLAAGFAADLALTDRRLDLSGVSVRIGGGTVQGEASLDGAAEPPALRLRASLHGVPIGGASGLPVDIAAARADGQIGLASMGHSVAAMLATLRGRAEIALSGGSLSGVALDGLPSDLPLPSVARALAGGLTGFAGGQLAASVAAGIVTLGDSRLALADGSLALSGSYDLSQDVADLLLSYRPAPAGGGGGPVIGLALVGRSGRAQRIPQLADLTRWRTARAQP